MVTQKARGRGPATARKTKARKPPGWDARGWVGSPFAFPPGSENWSAEEIEAYVARVKSSPEWVAHAELRSAILGADYAKLRRSPAHRRLHALLFCFFEDTDPTLSVRDLYQALHAALQADVTLNRGGRPSGSLRNQELRRMVEERRRANRSGKTDADIYGDVADDWNRRHPTHISIKVRAVRNAMSETATKRAKRGLPES